MITCAGIDLGGTKIEASVFDEAWRAVDSRRVPTPKDYHALIQALSDQVDWINTAGGADIPLGMGVPGRHEHSTGRAVMANVVADGQRLRADVSSATEREIAFGNDCDLFAFSEATLGAGRGYKTVFGLITGTGIGGGTCFGGVLHTTKNGATGEVGHLPVSARLVEKYALPLLPCGCGRIGCYETLGAGPGMARIAAQHMGQPFSAAEIATSERGDAKQVIGIWVEVIAELIGALQLTIDPDCVVLGGGLSNLPDVATKLGSVVSKNCLRGTTPPVIANARYGDSSGTRGAALLALNKAGLK